jgi:hypothetical protein
MKQPRRPDGPSLPRIQTKARGRADLMGLAIGFRDRGLLLYHYTTDRYR